MDVGDALAGIGATVDDNPKAPLELELDCEFAGDDKQVAEDSLVLRLRLGKARDQLLWDYQEVNGSLGLDVMDHDAAFVLVLYLCRDLTVDDALEEGPTHGFSFKR